MKYDLIGTASKDGEKLPTGTQMAKGDKAIAVALYIYIYNQYIYVYIVNIYIYIYIYIYELMHDAYT